VVVGWCHLMWNLSACVNNCGFDGRVSSERKSLEPGHNNRVPRSRHLRRAGPLDVHASHCLIRYF